MTFNVIETLAIILIIIALVKIAIVFIAPNILISFVSKMYSVPSIISAVGFLLSVLVLYFIVNSGISIIEVLAVCLFVGLLMVTGLANYANEFTALLGNQGIYQVLKNMWLYFAFWVFLIAWGIYVLLFK